VRGVANIHRVEICCIGSRGTSEDFVSISQVIFMPIVVFIEKIGPHPTSQALLITIIVRELSPWQILIPASLMFQNTDSQHIFKDLVDSLSLAIQLLVIGRIVDQVSPEGCV
jgi:hypothetical protein